MSLRHGVLGVVLALSGCHTSSAGSADLDRPPTDRTLVADRGVPAVFQIECGQHALNPSTQHWEPITGTLRVDTWLYANGEQSDLFVLVNGDVVKRQTVAKDISAYPSPGLDPFSVGCGEAESVIAKLAKSEPSLTTDGTSAAGQFSLGQVQLKSSYYVLGHTGLLATFADGKMIALVTL